MLGDMQSVKVIQGNFKPDHFMILSNFVRLNDDDDERRTFYIDLLACRFEQRNRCESFIGSHFTGNAGAEEFNCSSVLATRDARLKFMKEARLMRKYNHKHVVKILGVAVHEHPLMLVMEVCPSECDSKKYLRLKRI
uniref:Pkinase_Tyr domain-containing protein n=1 Tax=Angiostrongylus cantonensis TaxID=6313 RepID=A0A0K0D8M4_ANGCA